MSESAPPTQSFISWKPARLILIHYQNCTTIKNFALEKAAFDDAGKQIG